MMMENHQPTIVNDSTKALDVAGSVSPDLITLDLMMPVLSGFELCESLRQDPRFAKTPIMIVSAKDDSGSKERAIQLGANAYLTKPFNVDELLRKIRELVSL